MSSDAASDVPPHACHRVFYDCVTEASLGDVGANDARIDVMVKAFRSCSSLCSFWDLDNATVMETVRDDGA